MIQLVQSKRKKQPEFYLQVQVCNYISLQYPDIFFMSDTVASLKLTVTQQVRNKKIQCQKFKCTDLIIFMPNKDFHGLFIELKASTPFNKDGSLKKQIKKVKSKGKIYEYDHLEEQQKSIEILNEIGYFACFSWTFEMTKNIIDNYLKNR